MTLTLTTSGAVANQTLWVKFYDYSAASQTLSWVNTENGQQTVPVTSAGSTSIPLSIGFSFNSVTSEWTFIGVA